MFNFNFGKKKPDIKQYAIIGIVLSSIIATLSQCTGISQNNIWDLLDEVQRKYFPNSILNELILQDPHAIERRVKRDVDRALDEVIPEYNRFIEEENKKYKPINLFLNGMNLKSIHSSYLFSEFHPLKILFHCIIFPRVVLPMLDLVKTTSYLTLFV